MMEDYLIMKIQTIDDIKYLENRVKIKPNIGLNIEVNESLKNSVDQVLYTNNLVWTWFHYGKFFYKIKFYSTKFSENAPPFPENLKNSQNQRLIYLHFRMLSQLHPQVHVPDIRSHSDPYLCAACRLDVHV